MSARRRAAVARSRIPDLLLGERSGTRRRRNTLPTLPALAWWGPGSTRRVCPSPARPRYETHRPAIRFAPDRSGGGRRIRGALAVDVHCGWRCDTEVLDLPFPLPLDTHAPRPSIRLSGKLLQRAPNAACAPAVRIPALAGSPAHELARAPTCSRRSAASHHLGIRPREHHALVAGVLPTDGVGRLTVGRRDGDDLGPARNGGIGVAADDQPVSGVRAHVLSLGSFVRVCRGHCRDPHSRGMTPRRRQ